jgi:group I intron endonuclease
MTTTYIYCLFDPITEQPRYIGKSDNPHKRYLEHLNEKGKTKKINWIKSLKKKSLVPILETLDEVRSEDWKIMECMYISLFKGWGFDLVNGTYGGDGSSSGAGNPMFGKKGIDNPNYGKKHSEEFKKHHSELQAGKNNSFYGKKHTQESLKKISQRSSGENNPNYGGKSQTLEFFKKQSISNSKKPLLVIDTITNEINEFMNSKEAANFLNVGHSLIRTAKSNNLKVRRRYLIQDKIQCL